MCTDLNHVGRMFYADSGQADYFFRDGQHALTGDGHARDCLIKSESPQMNANKRK